jgi:hypothetical protein
MTRPLHLALALAVLSSAALAAQIDAAAYRYRLDLPLPADGAADELYALRLPDSLFAATEDSLADIRIVDETGQAVPFEVTRRTEMAAVTQRVDVAVNRVGFSDRPGENRIEIVYEQTNASTHPQGLAIRTPLRNFEKSVTVDVSPDGRAWSNLVADAVVFDASRYMDVSRKEVDLPPSTSRFFRVVLHEVTDLKSSPVSEISRFAGRAESGEPQYTDRQNTLQNRDFRIDGIDFWRRRVMESTARERLVLHPVSNFVVRTDEKKQQTVVRFEAGRVPATIVTVQTGARNFSRPCTLYALYPNQRLDQARPVLARGTLSRILFRTLDETRLELKFPESRAPAFELVIENGDNPELPITGVQVRGPEFQALFFANAPGRRRLLAGSPQAAPPRFDLSAIRMALDRGLGGRLLAPAGDLEPNPEWNRKGFEFNRKAALGGALVVMVLVLGFALFKAARRFDSGEPAA